MQDQEWKIDKRVPLALILAIIAQTMGIVWWAADVNGRISALEKQDLAGRLQVLEQDVPVIREKINNIEKATGRIEDKIDELTLNFKKHAGIEDLMKLSLSELGEIVTS